MIELSHSDLIAQILDAMRSAGCAPHDPRVVVFGPPKAGLVHRYRVDGDKSGSANGWFIFYDDGIPAGAFGSWKTGVTESWCAQREHELSAADRAQRDRHLADAKAARAKQEKQVRADARQRAADLWAKSAETVDAKHPYLLKKQIPAIGLRQLGPALVIPILDGNGELHSLQFIGADGRKTFLTGGAIAGNSCPLGEFADPETILICEGYATGVSLHRASGLPVVVAFNAGNLKAVAAGLRLRHPHAALIVCGDDDRFTDGNPGRRKALEAAVSVNGFAIFPLFDGIETDAKPTDFNDLNGLSGLDALKAQLDNALATCQAPHQRRAAFEAEIDATDDFETLTAGLPRRILDSGLPKATVSYLLKRIARKAKVPVADLQEQVKQATSPAGWKAKLRYDDNGALRPTLANLTAILNHHPDWRGVLFYDQFSGDTIKRRAPPVPNATLGEWTDLDSRKTRVWLETQFDLEAGNDLVDDAVAVVSDQHAVHLVLDYLGALVWDRQPRLKTAALRYLGADDTPVHRFVLQAWMIGAVKRVTEPGVKFDNVLVLEGPQAIGKSTALDILGCGWHAESITDAGSKDSLVTLRGKWIVEFSELDALGRVEVSRVKQHVSARQDVYRQPYGKRSVTVPRQNVFAASCNPEKYLRDETGGRRFWPIRCGRVDLEALRRDRDQLWAEAVHLAQQGEQYWATPDMAFLRQAQEERYMEDPWEEPIMEFAYGKRDLLISDVLGHLRVDLPKQTQADKNRVAKILGRLGYRCKPAKRFGRTYRVYFLEGTPCL
jgi:predicted P-loop ATPase/phage/plasmid primase-like uncharacterized protein